MVCILFLFARVQRGLCALAGRLELAEGAWIVRDSMLTGYPEGEMVQGFAQ